MAKFCGACGTRIPQGAAFCPECGAAVPAPAPQKKQYCRSCGAELRPGSPICPCCGEGMTAPPAGQPGVYSLGEQRNASAHSSSAARGGAPARSSARGGVPTRSAEVPHRSSTTRPGTRDAEGKPRGKGLRRFLALVILAAFGVTAFKYPGFLLKKEEPSISKPPVSQTAKPTGTAKPAATAQPSAAPQEPGTETVVVPGPAEEITLSFTPQQLSAAPAAAAAVSKGSPAAECGGLRVDFRSWNLPEEEDTFTVRSLGTHPDPASGWTLECWDLSLASGTHEFFTDIQVTVPRTEGDGAAVGFVCWNEETEKWEELYSRVSEDGTSYLVYMKHFSPLAKKSILGWKEKSGESKPSSAPAQLFDQYQVDSELFIELETRVSTRAYQQERTPYNDRMQAAVRLDYDRYWALAEQGKLSGIDLVLGKYASDSLSIQNALNELAAVGAPGAVKTAAGVGGAAMNLADVLKAGPEAGKPMARVFGGIGAALGMMDVAAAYTRITYDAQLRQKTITQSILEDHKMDLVSGVTGALSTVAGTAALLGAKIPTPVTWGLAAVSLTIYAAGQTGSALEPYTSSGITAGMFDYYAHYAFGADNRLPDLPNLEAKPMRILREMISAHPLTYGLKEDKTPDDSWVQLVSNLMQLSKLCPEEVPPERIPELLDQIIDLRARRFFELSNSSLQQLFRDFRESKSADPEYTVYIFMSEYDGYTQDDADKLYAYETARLRVVASKAAEQVMESLIREARKDTQDYLEKNLVAQLNRTMSFHVTDTQVKSFQDSVYYRDFYGIPGNRDWKLSEKETDPPFGDEEWELTVADYSDPELMLPISFQGVSEPVFLPSQVRSSYDTEAEGFVDRVERVSANEFYPNADNFIPRVGAYRWGDRDVVYKCTVYHYMLMGCPGIMVFRTFPEEAYKQPEEGEEPKSYAPLTELTVTIESALEELKYDEERGEYNLYIQVDGAVSIESFLGSWVYNGGSFTSTLTLSYFYSSGELSVFETYKDAEGEEMDGGIMDSFKLDVSTKTLTLGDDRLDYGTMKLRLKDENHLTLITGDSTYELTKVPEPED